MDRRYAILEIDDKGRPLRGIAGPDFPKDRVIKRAEAFAAANPGIRYAVYWWQICRMSIVGKPIFVAFVPGAQKGNQTNA